MDTLDFIFRLGVVFAIYGFLFGLIEIALLLLSGGRKRSLGEIYLVRAVKYFFLVDVTFLFCLEEGQSDTVVLNQVILAGIILLTYFVGKFQNNQNKTRIFQMMGTGLPNQLRTTNFNARVEIAVISIALIMFGVFWYYPQIASNPLSLWFHESILNIESTPIFGFIFKVIGFFVLINLISKMVNGLTFILSGEAFVRRESDDDNDDFIDYTEVD